MDNLNATSEAIIVVTVTAKKAGVISNSPSVNYIDNNGNNTVNASKSSLEINKDIRTFFSYSISNTKVKKDSYFNVTIIAKNIGLDASGLYTVQNKLSSAFSKISTTTTNPFKYPSDKWAGTIGSNKTMVLKMKIKMNKKGNYKLPVLINGQTKKTNTITGS